MSILRKVAEEIGKDIHSGEARLTSINKNPIFMAPRFKATPRRGRHSGQHGGDGGRGRYSPRRISPLAQASPPSNRSGDSEQFICNTVQSARFRFRRRTNRPFISTLVTVIFEEEDEEENSMTNSSAEQTPSNPNSSSPSRGIEDSSYAPSSQSKIKEESAGDYIEEQAEVIQEIVGLQGKDSLDLAPEHANISSSRTEEGQGTPRKHKDP